MIYKLTDHQRAQLEYLDNSGGVGLMMGMLNMSVLAALMRRNLIKITLTQDGKDSLAAPQA